MFFYFFLNSNSGICADICGKPRVLFYNVTDSSKIWTLHYCTYCVKSFSMPVRYVL